MIRLEAATVLLQWATGGMAFCWFTTRRRQVGLGYGWLLRAIYGVLALAAVLAGVQGHGNAVRDSASAATSGLCFTVLAVSVHRRAAGVAGQRVEHERRTARVAAMTGRERPTGRRRAVVADPANAGNGGAGVAGSANARNGDADVPGAANAGGGAGGVAEFAPALDLLPVASGLIGVVVAAADTGGPVALSLVRVLAGAAFLGAVTDAMLLGHWYLVQPGLPRRLLHELVDAVGMVWPLEIVVMLLPTGMASVWTGAVDDGWGGTLGWFWAACAVTTIVLVVVTKAALREREYSAVMAATGLLYLAILTAFGTDLVARAVLSA